MSIQKVGPDQYQTEDKRFSLVRAENKKGWVLIDHQEKHNLMGYHPVSSLRQAEVEIARTKRKEAQAG